MTWRSIRFCTLLACLALIHSAAFAQSGVTIIGVSGSSIATFDPVSGKALNSHPITVPGKTVAQTFGVAREPQTGTIYAIVGYSFSSGRFLVTLDPATGAATQIGQTTTLSDIAAGTDGTLYGIGGNSGSGGLLYTLDKTTAAATPVAQLSSGSGQTLAFNAEDGLIYHGADTCDQISCFFYIESFDPQSPSGPAKRVFAQDLSIEPGSMAHLRGPYFMVGDVFNLRVMLLNVATGRADSLSSERVWSGLTTVPAGGTCPPVATLYATGPFEGPSLLHSLDPTTGAATLVGPVGFNNVTGIDFASDAVLYAVGTRDDDSGVQVLLTIDPCTGEGTEVGPTGTTLRELMAAPGGGLYAYSGQNFSTIDKVTGAASTIGNSAITADDFGLEYSPTDDKIYFANIFNAIGTLYSIDPATGASTNQGQLTLPANITALRAMDFNPGNNTMYALIADSAFPGTTSLATVDTTGHSISSVATTSRFTTLAFKNGTANSNYLLTVIKQGIGAGTVTSSPSGIDCGTTCDFAFTTGASVTLTAAVDPGSRFDGWAGACSGTGPCVVAMSAMRTVRAQFTTVHHLLLQYGVNNQGHGASVTINDGVSTQSCALDQGPCDLLAGQGAVLLHAVPSVAGTFKKWETVCVSGDPSTVDCQIDMTADKTVGVDFIGANRLTVTVATSDPQALVFDTNHAHSCVGPATCNFDYAPGLSVDLFALSGTHSVFKQFSGDCSGTSCTVSMTADRTVTATFADAYFINLSNLGTGSGTVNPYVYCDFNNGCNATFEVGTTTVLTAIPFAGSQFIGWGGACSGTGTCQITSNSPVDITVTATFNQLPPVTLTVTKAGNGSGTVDSNPGGIACGLTCNAQFAAASMVTLSATPATGTNFASWSGDCAGSVSVCQVSMTTARNVTATFTLQSFTLNVAAAGTGAGTITGTGINCPNTCSVANVFGTMLTLTATPNAESSFTGWSGACTGTGACQVTFDAAKNVTANFAFVGPFNFANTSLPLSVPAGQPGVFSLSIQEHTASSGTITFTCVSGLPAGSTCSFNPNGIAFTAGTNTSINTLLTITTLPRTIGMNVDPSGGMNPIWAISLFAWVFVVPRRRRRQALMMLALALVVLLPACGGGGHSTTKTQSGTAAGTYTVVVNGSTGSAVKTTTVTLVVQ